MPKRMADTVWKNADCCAVDAQCCAVFVNNPFEEAGSPEQGTSETIAEKCLTGYCTAKTSKYTT